MANIREAIEKNAIGPKSASSDAGSVQQHAIRDQIEADEYLARKAASRKKFRGFKFMKIVPPGA